LKAIQHSVATFEAQAQGAAAVVGALDFATVTELLHHSTESISSGAVSSVDLKGVTSSDSAGLSLLIEWLSIARAAGHPLVYRNVPAQLRQLAKLSEVDALLLSPTN
jgi:phospholipid transport system transporter-binding protein